MSNTDTSNRTSTETPDGDTVDMKLEVVVVPVSDVDRAKRFYQTLGWRLDADFATGDDFRVVQLTPPARRARSSSARGSRQPCRAQLRVCSSRSTTSTPPEMSSSVVASTW